MRRKDRDWAGPQNIRNSTNPIARDLSPNRASLSVMSNTPDIEEASAQTHTPGTAKHRLDPGAPASNAAGPTSSPEQSVLLTDRQAGSGAPVSPEPVEPTHSTSTDENSDVVAPARKVDPMQGMKLEAILNELVGYFGWDEMGYRINIRCFNEDPSIGSSLKFLRKTPWARKKVDTLFLTMRAEQAEQAEQAGETAPL
jgi:hypothetical protein